MSGLEGVLAAHEIRGGRVYFDGSSECKCGVFVHNIRERRAHVAAAITAHLAGRLAAEDMREAVAEALSVGEMTPYQPGAHPDHNRWSWRGDGHGEAVREEFRKQADAALAAVRGVLGVAE